MTFYCIHASGIKQTHAHGTKLRWDVANFVIKRKLTARTCGISKVVKGQTMMTVKMRVTVIKNENNLNEKLLFEIPIFLCHFLVNLVTSF